MKSVINKIKKIINIVIILKLSIRHNIIKNITSTLYIYIYIDR